MGEQYMVPMYESERGWGAKIDGYAGPFDSKASADAFRISYNLANNNEPVAPEWYIAALPPVVYDGRVCEYRSSVA